MDEQLIQILENSLGEMVGLYGPNECFYCEEILSRAGDTYLHGKCTLHLNNIREISHNEQGTTVIRLIY